MELKIIHGLFLFGGGGGGQAPQDPPPPPPNQYIYASGSGVMSQKIEGGTIFAREARERSDRAGEGVGGGLGSFFIFRLEKCAIWGILKKEIST